MKIFSSFFLKHFPKQKLFGGPCTYLFENDVNGEDYDSMMICFDLNCMICPLMTCDFNTTAQRILQLMPH